MTHAEYSIKLLAEAPTASMPAWSVVLYFYAAVHAVNHALYGGVDVVWSHDHSKRELDMRGSKRLKTVVQKHRILKRWSEDARYRPWTHASLLPYVANAERLAREVMIACGLNGDQQSAGSP